MIQIFGDLRSGNCLKVKYVADFLDIAYEWVSVDILAGESREASFLRRNPQGQVPVVELADGRTLAQSNAIMAYLARGSTLLPEEPFLNAKVHEWLFWEQYSHEPYIAVCRFHMVYREQPASTREAWRVERGEHALDTLEKVLSERDWLVAGKLTIADVALLAYTRLAGEGGFELGRRPAVRRWIGACETALGLG